MSTRSRSSAIATSSSISGARHRRRLLDEDVLAGLERPLRELVVRRHGGRDARPRRGRGRRASRRTSRPSVPADSAPRTRRALPSAGSLSHASSARSAKLRARFLPHSPRPAWPTRRSKLPDLVRALPVRARGVAEVDDEHGRPRRAPRSRCSAWFVTTTTQSYAPGSSGTELIEIPFSANDGTCGSW